MNAEYLKLFVRVAATKNMSSAGKELGLSPAVSGTYIKKLEQSLGVRLVHRTTRRVSLTEEGLNFLPHAKKVLESIETAQSSVDSGSSTPKGTLRITAPASFGRMHIIPALSGFVERYPDLKIDLTMSDSIMDMVEGGFDIAVRNSSLKDSSFIARKLADDTRIICASPEYLQKHGEPSSPDELVNHKCVDLVGIENWVFEIQDTLKSIKIESALRVNNGEAVRDACVNGIGITICSIWCAYEKLHSGELVQILRDYPLVNETAIWAVYPSSRLLAPKVRAFIDYYLECFGYSPYWEAS